MSVTHLERLNASRSESDHAVLCRHASSKPISRDRTRSSLKHKTAQTARAFPRKALPRGPRADVAPAVLAQMRGSSRLAHSGTMTSISALKRRSHAPMTIALNAPRAISSSSMYLAAELVGHRRCGIFIRPRRLRMNATDPIGALRRRNDTDRTGHFRIRSAVSG